MTDTKMGAFDVAGASVRGAEHARLGLPAQDAYAWCQRDGRLVAVVTDGCGSGRCSEVGARLGARLFTQCVMRHLEAGRTLADRSLWFRVRAEVLAELRPLAHAMGGSFAQVITDYFLFTVVGVAITEVTTAVFAIGDGVFAVDGELVALGPFPGNAPPYLAYDLLPDAPPAPLVLPVLRPSFEVGSVLLGTDGLLDLDRDSLRDQSGGTAALLAEPRFTDHPDALRRHLALLARESVEPDWERRRLRRRPGQLRDDTTAVLVRRRVDSHRRTA